MKKNLFFLISSVPIFLNAQVGIGTETPHSSAILEVSAQINPHESNTRGLLIPRVNLSTTANGTTPVANPVDGTLVYNKTVDATNDVKKGLYYWNTTGTPAWDRGLLYQETPKTSIISFTGNATDFPILTNGGNGSFVYVGSNDVPGANGFENRLFPDNYVFDSFAKFMGIEPYLVPSTSTVHPNKRFLTIAPGKYIVEISMGFNSPPCPNRSTTATPIYRCTPVAGDRATGYYYMGLLYDIYLFPKNADGTLQSVSRVRKEDGALSKTNETYRVTETFLINIAETDPEVVLAVTIGRMTGSYFTDTTYVIPSESYIKINKF